MNPLSTTAMRAEYAAARCNTGEMVPYMFPGDGKDWPLYVEVHTVPAWKLFADAMTRHGYLFRESAGGTYNCRKIAGTSVYSLHSYGLALDLNPSKNPYDTSSTTDMPPAFIADVKAIVCGNGRKVFQWGGDWSPKSDKMHFQIGATKADLATGVTSPTATTGDDDMFCEYGDTGNAPRYLHARLERLGFTVADNEKDGEYFGDSTADALKAFMAPTKNDGKRFRWYEADRLDEALREATAKDVGVDGGDFDASVLKPYAKKTWTDKNFLPRDATFTLTEEDQ